MSDQFVAEIRIFGCNFAPLGWALCNGQLMPISQNTALFSLIGRAHDMAITGAWNGSVQQLNTAATTLKPPPEFGSAEDFQLAQALNRLKGKTVLVSKTAVERKAEAATAN